MNLKEKFRLENMQDKINIYPIKIERTWKQNYKLIEWHLGNTCNYDCLFCSTENKDGSKYWLNIDTYKNVCNQLITQADAENKKVIFQFTGGEPTLYSDLLELLRYIKKIGGYVNLLSNGSRTLRWWKELAEEDLLLCLFLSAHPEQNADIQHLCKLTELFKNTSTLVVVNCTALPEHFEKALDYHSELVNNGFCIASLKVMHPIDKFNYTEEQLNLIAKNVMIRSKQYITRTQLITYSGKMRVLFNDNTQLIEFGNKLISLGHNKFFGYKCSIGIDNLTIIHDKIYRGVCQQGGVIGSIYEPVHFMYEPLTCLKNSCTCVTDYQEPKFKI